MNIAKIHDSTLAFAESAFTTIINLSDLPEDEDTCFRVVSEIKMGLELWKTKVATGTEDEKKDVHIFRPEDKSKAVALKEGAEKINPFLFFCAYFPSKHILQIFKIKAKSVFNDIIHIHKKYLPTCIYDEATCIIHKGKAGGMMNYTFKLATTLDPVTGNTQLLRTPLPQEAKDLLKRMPFWLDNVYSKEDPFCAPKEPVLKEPGVVA